MVAGRQREDRRIEGSDRGNRRLEKEEFVQGTTKFVCFELPNRARTCSEAE